MTSCSVLSYPRQSIVTPVLVTLRSVNSSNRLGNLYDTKCPLAARHGNGQNILISSKRGPLKIYVRSLNKTTASGEGWKMSHGNRFVRMKYFQKYFSNLFSGVVWPNLVSHLWEQQPHINGCQYSPISSLEQRIFLISVQIFFIIF